MSIDEKLLQILACPACQGGVRAQDNAIVCVQCGRQYPVKNGIPVLLADGCGTAKQPPKG